MTYGTIIHCLDGNGVHFLLLLLLLLLMKFYYLTQLKDNNQHQNISSPRRTMNSCESFDLHLSKYCYHPHPDINLFIMKLKEYHNMIYVNL